MRNDATQSAAAALLEARRSGKPLAALPENGRPRDADEAYAIQDLVAREIGPVRAWKTGASSPEAEPSYAPIFELVDSPARFDSAGLRLFGIEAEIAFRLARELPDYRYSPDDPVIKAAIASMHLAIELVETRFAVAPSALADFDAYSKLADNLVNGALVIGPAIADWSALAIDLSRPEVTVTMDGQVIARTLGNSGGDPLRLLARLAEHAARRRGGLRAGQVITTGSITGIAYARPGSVVRADFAALGAVEIAFGASER